MPTYEYECLKCQYHFERFQGMTEKPLSRCPTCRGKIRRLVSGGSGIIFKGSGFYSTDYRSASYKEAVKRENADGGPTDRKKEDKKTTSPTSKDTKSKPTSPETK